MKSNELRQFEIISNAAGIGGQADITLNCVLCPFETSMDVYTRPSEPRLRLFDLTDRAQAHLNEGCF